MAIHHSHIKQAEKAGFTLEERGSLVRAFHPATATEVFGVSGKDAVLQMLSFLGIHENDHDVRLTKLSYDIDAPVTHRRLRKSTDDTVSEQQSTPHELEKLFKRGQITWIEASQPVFVGVDPASPDGDISVTAYGRVNEDGKVELQEIPFFEDEHPKDPPVDPTPLVERSENGVPLDGAIAYKEGVTAADCPYSSEEDDDEAEYNKFVLWNEQWDQAADEATDDEEDGKGGSVVASKYRTKYAEEGHPNHCGDWLAELLNNYCIGDKNTDLEVFETICGLNGVDTSKYRREGNGWQGRIRMTGRNLLAKRVFEAKQICVPNKDVAGDNDSDNVWLTAPADWLAAQRYKAKSNG